MWSILICDNDPKILKALESQIQNLKIENIDLVRCFDKLDGLISFLEEYPKEPYVILLDIKLDNENNGVDAAIKIKKYKKDVEIIFISGYKDCLSKIYEAEHIYFLAKPFAQEDLKNAIIKAVKKLDNDVKYILPLFNKKNGITKIFQNDILYIESSGRKLYIYTQEEIYIIYKKIVEIMPLLSEHFVRCHSSFVVNMKKIQKLENKQITLDNGKAIKISRSFYNNTKNKFIYFLGEKLFL